MISRRRVGEWVFIRLTRKKRGYELEFDKIDRASSVRGGQIRLIEDDRDGYTWRGSFREGKKFLRSIGLPRETKVGRVRSKS